jgi:hypothetical protein
MGLMDSAKRIMKGRSAAIERSVDTAVDRLGHYSDSFRRHAETVKERARSLDSERMSTDDPGTPPPVAPPAPPASAPSPTAGPSLRGDLVEPDHTNGGSAAGGPPTG